MPAGKQHSAKEFLGGRYKTGRRSVMKKNEHENLLESLSFVVGTCFLFSFLLLLFWFIFYLVGGDWGYKVHSTWFELSRHDYDVLNYFGMAFVKMCAILFFLFPYLAIRLLLRRQTMAK